MNQIIYYLALCFSITNSFTLNENSKTAEPNGYALLIGPNRIDVDSINEKYGNTVYYGSTEFVKKDIAAITEVLEIAGFPANNIKTLANKDVTKKEVLLAIKLLAEKTNKNDVIVIYFTGHGDQLPERIKGSEPDSLDELLVLTDDYLIDDDLNKALMEFNKNQKIIMIIDACHSGTTYKIVDQRTSELKKKETRLEKLKASSNHLFYDEIGKKQVFDLNTCKLSNISDDNSGLNSIYIGAAADNEEAKANSFGSFLTSAISILFSAKHEEWKDLSYRTFYCEIYKLVNISSGMKQHVFYKELGSATTYTNDYPLKIK